MLVSNRWLFPIELRGLATEDIECLPSYLMRAGGALGISPGQVLAHTISKYTTTYEPEKQGALGHPGSLSHYIRPNKSTQLLVRSIDAGTGLSGFSRSTFLSLGNALDRCLGAFSNHLRWCPACVGEFIRMGDKGYFKLIWQVNAVSHCHIHAAPLIQKCPHCGHTQTSWRYRSQCTNCIDCNKPLTCNLSPDNPIPSAATRSADIGILLKEIAEHSELQFPSGGIRALLDAIFDEVWSREDDLKMWKRIPRDTYLSIIDGTRPVTFETARAIAFQLGMSLPTLLTGKVAHTNHTLDPKWTENIPKEFKPTRHRKHHDLARIEKGIKLVLDVPPNECESLKQVARNLAVSEGCIRHQFPTACEEIIKRYQYRTQTEEMKLQMQVHAAVTGYLSSHPLGSSTPHGIVTTIWRDTGLPRERIRKAASEFLQFLHPTGEAPPKKSRKN
jgi:hypothetical protein